MVSDDKNRVFLLRAKTRDDYINAVFVDVSFSVYNANPASVSTFMAAQFKITIMYLVDHPCSASPVITPLLD